MRGQWGGPSLPRGVVSFLLTDIEGSTRLWDRDAAGMRQALDRHDAIIAAAVEGATGFLLKERGEGDSTFSVFERPTQAVAAALNARRLLELEPWPDGCALEVRFAVHIGEVAERDGDYYGTEVNRAARIRSIAVGGQILVSEAVAAVVSDHLPEHAALVTLGIQELRGLARPERVSAVVDTRRPRREAIGGVCPYRGLLAFQPEDHDFFFGRERLVASLLTRVAEHRVLVVVGASGSGKSSLVRAGVVASLQHGALPGSASWAIRVMTPGAEPVRALVEAGSLDDHGGAVVLVVDQMEELFTNCRSAAERTAFIDHVLDAAEDPNRKVLVVAALRADFYGHCASIPRLAEALSAANVLLAPMDEAELRQAIEGPADVAGLRFDAGLVELMLRDLAHEPGSLPLLSHALLETWRRREGRELTVDGYNDSGGVRGAIARTADTVWLELDDVQRVTARRILLRLTELGEGTEDTRRRVDRSELYSVADTEDADAVLRILADARLITVDEHTVEVAHEALIREWPRLREWLDEDREVIRVHRHLTRAARDWSLLDRNPSELYRGPRLAAARELLADDDRTQLNDLERAFLGASIAAEDEEAAARERANRRLRMLFAGTAVALVISLVTGLLAFRQRNRADAQAKRAQAASISAEVDRVVAELPKLLNSDRELAGLLAVEAARLRPDPTTRGAVLSSLLGEPRLRLTRHGGGPNAWALEAFPDGRRVAAITQNSVDVWDVVSGHVVATRRVANALALDVAPDGGLVVVGSNAGTLTFLDATLKQVGDPLHFEAPIGSVAFSPDGRTLALALGAVGNSQPTNEGNAPRLVDVASRRTIRMLVGRSTTAFAVAFGERYVATGGGDGLIVLHDARTGEPSGTPLGFKGLVSTLDFSDHDRFLAAGTLNQGSGAQAVGVFDVAKRVPIDRQPMGSQGTVHARFSRDGSQLLVGDGSGVLRRWSTRDWNPIGRPIETQHGPALVPALRTGALITVGFDGTISSWNADDTMPSARQIAGSRAGGGVFSPDGTQVVTLGNDDAANVQRTSDFRVLGVLSVQGIGHRPLLAGSTHVAFSPNGRLLAVDSRQGDVQLFDAHSRERIGSPLHLSSHALNGVLFSPDSRLLVAYSADDAVQGAYVIDVATRRRVRVEPAAPRVVQPSFSPDGSRLVMGAVGANVFMYPVSHGSIGRGIALKQLPGGNVAEVVFSPDGRSLAFGSLDGSVQLYDSTTLRRVGDGITVGSSIVAQVTFSPDGHYLVAQDVPTQSFWLNDLRAHAPVGDPIPGSGLGFGWASFSQDSRTLILAHPGGSVLLDLDPVHWQATACTRAGRDLTRHEWAHYFSAAGDYQPACLRD